MYLLDTEVVFELGRARSERADAGLAAWAEGAPRTSLFISVLTLSELDAAAARLQDRAQSAAIRDWVDRQVAPAFEGRVLAVDAAVALRRVPGLPAASRNALIAATALEHGLTLATREGAAFRSSRVKVFNPWGYAPDASPEEDWGTAVKASSLWLRHLFLRG